MITRYGGCGKARQNAVPLSGKCWLLMLASVLMVFRTLPVVAQSMGSQSLQAPAGVTLLVVAGAIKHVNADGEAHFDRAMLEQLPTHEITTSTSVTDGVSRFKGPLLRDLLQLVGAQGTTVQALALNDYVVDIPISDFYDFDVLLAMYQDGERLEPSDKGPFWIVYPRDQLRRLQDIRYDYRWVWQLHRLNVK